MIEEKPKEELIDNNTFEDLEKLKEDIKQLNVFYEQQNKKLKEEKKISIEDSTEKEKPTRIEYDSKTFTNGKNIENFRREDFLTTKSQMSVSDVKVIKQKYRKVRKDGQKKIECELTVVVLKENIE